MTRPLEITGLSKIFPTPTGPYVAIKDFSVKIEPGEFVCILGHSGCGKSTLLSILAGLQRATLGGICIDGKEIDSPGTDRGVVFQTPSLLPWLTAGENVELAAGQAFPQFNRKQRQKHSRKYMEMLGIDDCYGQAPAELSLGTQQRVSLARALALESRYLLLDEPFGMLDSLTRFDLQDTLLEVWEHTRNTVVMVTHDLLPWLTAGENVELAAGQAFPQFNRKQRQKHSRKYMEMLGIDDCYGQAPAELSLGTQQRVSLARALALESRYLLLDEPFGMLDSLTRFDLQDTLLEVWEHTRNTVVMVTHDLLPWLTAGENVELAAGQAFPQFNRKQRQKHSRKYMEMLGIDDCYGQAPAELSLGTQQRVSLARALALESRYLLLDEPFGMLDSLTRFDLQDTLLEVWEHTRNTVVMVTHDMDEALYLADRLLLMTDGPEATLGEIVGIPFVRPRERASVLEHRSYYKLRSRIIGFLEDHALQSVLA